MLDRRAQSCWLLWGLYSQSSAPRLKHLSTVKSPARAQPVLSVNQLLLGAGGDSESCARVHLPPAESGAFSAGSLPAVMLPPCTCHPDCAEEQWKCLRDLQGWNSLAPALPQHSMGQPWLGRALLDRVTLEEFVLATLQPVGLQRTLVIDGATKPEWGDISSAEAVARPSLKSQLEVHRRGQCASEVAQHHGVWAGSPLGRILWCCEISCLCRVTDGTAHGRSKALQSGSDLLSTQRRCARLRAF